MTRALALTPDDEVSPTRARALFSLGTIVFPMGQPDLCEVLERQALELSLDGAQQQRLDTTLDEMRRRIDPSVAANAWMRGWSMSADEAVTLALAGWQIS